MINGVNYGKDKERSKKISKKSKSESEKNQESD
jgi:hypothetical protein